MDQQKRLLVALTLSFVLYAAFLFLFPPKPQPAQPEPAAAAATDGGTVAAATPAPGTPPPGPAVTPPAPGATTEPPPPERTVAMAGEDLDLTVSSKGAGLKKAELKGRKMREQQRLSILEGYKRLVGQEVPDAPQMDMALEMEKQPPPLAVDIQGARPFGATALYKVEEGEGGRRVTFTAREGNTEITKIFERPKGSYEFKLTVAVKNLGSEPLAGELGVHYARGVQKDTEQKASMFGGVGNESLASCSVGASAEDRRPDGKPATELKGPLNYVGINQQYFLGVVFPLDGPKEGRCVLDAVDTGRSASAYFPLQVSPGQEVRQSFGVYIGPKELGMLRTVPERMKDLGMVSAAPAGGTGFSFRYESSAFPHLDRTVDFGIWAVICRVMIPILHFFHSIFHNWGVAIILLTVAVKLVLLPLTHKSMVAAEGMKKLQPKMEELRKKYADDKERQNTEMIKLYQEAKVNPLGGCLPLLLQLPVWGALFTTLRNTFELYREPFISPLWTDLTFKDPTYLLPIALGVTMIITQKLQPQMVDAAQAKMMTYVMPVFFTAIMVNYPAGLTLYIFTNNLLSIAQQYLLRRYLEKKGVLTPKAKQDKEKTRREQNERQPGRKRSNP